MIKALLILIIFLCSGLMAETNEEFKARKRAGIERRKAERAEKAAAAKENRAVKPIPVAPKKVAPKKVAPKYTAAQVQEMKNLKYEALQIKSGLVAKSNKVYNLSVKYSTIRFNYVRGYIPKGIKGPKRERYRINIVRSLSALQVEQGHAYGKVLDDHAKYSKLLLKYLDIKKASRQDRAKASASLKKMKLDLSKYHKTNSPSSYDVGAFKTASRYISALKDGTYKKTIEAWHKKENEKTMKERARKKR